MSGVTALVSAAVPGEATVNLYYTTTSKQIAVSLRSGTGPDRKPVSFQASTTDYQGYVQIPGQIACSTFQGLPIVAAATVPKDNETAASKNNISLVSPVYESLVLTTKMNPNVAMCATNQQTNQAYVYYVDGTGDANMNIMEYTIDDGSKRKVSLNSDVLSNSSLAAYCNSANQRLVVYQDYDEVQLRELQVSDRQTTIIQNAQGATEGTSLAISFFEDKAYLYYVNSRQTLLRIVRNPTTGWKLSTSQTVTDAPKTIKGLTQVTVVQANRINHVFYMAENTADGIITHVLDPIDNIKEDDPEAEEEHVKNEGRHGHRHHHHHDHEERKSGHEEHHKNDYPAH